jgi:uncharacterized protein
MRFRSVLLSCTLLFAVFAAHADDSSKTVKVHELFRLIKLDKLSAQMMDQVMAQINSGLVQQMTGVQISAADQKKLDDFSGQVKLIVSSAVAWEKLEPDYTKLYTDAYTEQQLDDLLAFYKSPTGQAVVEKTPILLKESSALAQKRMTAVMPDLQKLVKDFIAASAHPSQSASQQ